ncbi:transporter substrate-binding domain-containing protein [Massilia sp. W12]|uniref:substrate-binding periplasmic protein n=1 Tax=Massilia sp. W12 TaxID=3126507 RepID=UPI0030CC6D3A
MRSLSAGLLALFMLFCSTAAVGQALRVLTEETHPLNYTEGGKVGGYSTGLLQATLRHAGLQAEIEVMPWRRAMQLTLLQPNTLLYSTARIPEREQQFLWIGPLSPINIYAYKLRKRTDLQAASVHELARYRTGMVRQMASSRVVLEQTGLSEEAFEFAPSSFLNLQKLLAGRLDYVILMEWNFISVCKLQKLDLDAFEPAFLIDGSRSLYFALNRDSDPALVARLQSAWDVVQKSGLPQRLRQQYLRRAD